MQKKSSMAARDSMYESAHVYDVRICMFSLITFLSHLIEGCRSLVICAFDTFIYL